MIFVYLFVYIYYCLFICYISHLVVRHVRNEMGCERLSDLCSLEFRRTVPAVRLQFGFLSGETCALECQVHLLHTQLGLQLQTHKVMRQRTFKSRNKHAVSTNTPACDSNTPPLCPLSSCLQLRSWRSFPLQLPAG